MVNSRFKFVVCRGCPNSQNRRPLSGKANILMRNCLERKFMVTVEHDSIICNKCRHKCRKLIKLHPGNMREEGNCRNDDLTYEPPSKKINRSSQEKENVDLSIPRAGASHSYCFICRKPGKRLINVMSKARYQLFIANGILLSKRARCCPKHINDNCLFTPDSMTTITEKGIKINTSSCSKDEVVALIEHLRCLAIENKNKRVRFDDGYTDDDYMALTGLNKVEFHDLLTYYSGHKSDSDSNRTCLGIFLTKMRSGLSNRVLAALFHIKRTHVSRCISKVRNSLSDRFLKENLGFSHVSRSDVITNKTRTLAKMLFSENECNPPAILVLDGTYLYIQKSTNFSLQRRCFSLHKKRPLVKPMMIVTTSGYIVSVIGPYVSDGKNSDAGILNHMFKSNVEDIKSWVCGDDVFIVDRGFRDSLSLLKEMGIRAEMPSFLVKGQKQLSTVQANKARLITKIRWVVESVNSRLKQWKFFDKVIPNVHLPYLHDYLKITCAIFNKYKKPLSETKNNLEDISVATKMLALSKNSNQLQQKVETKEIGSLSYSWKPVDDSSIKFPSLSNTQLQDLTLGIYTLRLAKSYTDEHLSDDGKYILLVSNDHEGILGVKMQSRHTSNMKYQLWIEYNDDEVTAWYCKCRAGSRVVGTCAHVASVICFLSKRPVKGNPPHEGWKDYLLDAAEQ